MCESTYVEACGPLRPSRRFILLLLGGALRFSSLSLPRLSGVPIDDDVVPAAVIYGNAPPMSMSSARKGKADLPPHLPRKIPYEPISRIFNYKLFSFDHLLRFPTLVRVS